MANAKILSIVKELSNRFNGEKNLLSLSLVGSFYNPNKKIEYFNDLDFVFIYHHITRDNLKKLKKEANYLKETYSNKDIGITYTFNDGPIKVISKKPKTIMVHFLIYSNKSYSKYQSNLTKYSFNKYKPLLGKSLKSISKIQKIEAKDLFNKIDGTYAMKYWIRKQNIFYIQPTTNGVKFIKKNLNKKEYLEIIFYSVLNLANNIMRLNKEYTSISKDMCCMFKKKISIRLNGFPEEIYRDKRRLRKKGDFSNKEVKQISINSLKFISQCEEFIKSHKKYKF